MTQSQHKTLILSLIALATRAAGQEQPAPPGAAAPVDGGPVVIGTPRETWSGFKLLRLDSALDFKMQSQVDKLNQTGQPDQKLTETRYRESLDLSGEAIFGHRNLLDINGSAQIGREDIFSKNNLDPNAGNETDLLTLFDVNALVLGSSSLPTDIFARREQSDLNRAFAGAITETLTEEGIATRFQTSKATASARYFHRDTQLTGGFGNLNSDVTQDSLTLNTGILLTPSQRLDAGITLDKIDEQQAGGFSDSYDRRDASIVHTFTFGEDRHPNELRSTLRLYDQTGRQSQSTIRLDEALTLRHTDRFETRYNLSVNNTEIRGDSQQLNRADASAKYRLFDSLTATGTLGAQQLSAPGGFTSDELFTSGELDYVKTVPYGRLDVTVGLGLNSQQNSARGSTISVFDETYTFTDGFPIIIARRNIVAGSIIITPVAGFPVYMEGADYRVLIFQDRAEIRNIVGGAFVNGQTLKITYDIGPEPGYDVDTTSTTFSIRYFLTEGWLKGTELYTTYRTVAHSVSAADPSQFVLDDTTDLILGTRYVRDELEARYEYNVHDSTLSPYDSQQIEILYTLPLGQHSTLTADLTHEIIDFTKENNSVTFDRASVRCNARLSEQFDLDGQLEYRKEDSSLSGQSTGFDQTLGVTWHWRKTSAYASFRNSTLQGPSSDQTSQLFQFGLRRTF